MKNYNAIQNVVQLNFNNYRCNESKVIETYCFRNEDGKELSDCIKIEQIDMILAQRKQCINKREEMIIRWCKVLTTNSVENMIKIIGG